MVLKLKYKNPTKPSKCSVRISFLHHRKGSEIFAQYYFEFSFKNINKPTNYMEKTHDTRIGKY